MPSPDLGRSVAPLRAVVGWSWRGKYAGDKIVVWRLECGHAVELPSNRGGRKRCRCLECQAVSAQTEGKAATVRH